MIYWGWTMVVFTIQLDCSKEMIASWNLGDDKSHLLNAIAIPSHSSQLEPVTPISFSDARFVLMNILFMTADAGAILRTQSFLKRTEEKCAHNSTGGGLNVAIAVINFAKLLRY